MQRRPKRERRTVALVVIATLLSAGAAHAHKGTRHFTMGSARLYDEGGFRTLIATIVDGGPSGVDGGVVEVTRQTCPRPADCAATYRISCAHTLVVLPAESHIHNVHAAAVKTSGSEAFPARYFLTIVDRRAGVDFLGFTTSATQGPCEAEASRSLVSSVTFSTWP